MKTLILIIAGLSLVACSSTPVKRSKFSDPAHRIMVDPESLNSQEYVRLTNSLVKSGKWLVVDRSNGFKAVKKEQERLHKDEPDRYELSQKYAMWGKMYGVGAIVVPDLQCQVLQEWTGNLFKKCLQVLTIVNANTSEIITSIDAQYESTTQTYAMGSDWEKAVDELNDAFPKNFEADKKTKELVEYEQLAKEEAIRVMEAK